MNRFDDLHELTDEERQIEEAAEEAERLMDDDLAEWKPVKVRVAKEVKHVYSMRIGAEELDEIADAAEAAGKDVSAFIREAALNEARRRKAGKSAVDDVRKKAQELAEAVKRL
jgi:uncharacterized protein (DUF1778 family)